MYEYGSVDERARVRDGFIFQADMYNYCRPHDNVRNLS